MPELRLLPVPRTAVFRDENYYIWCGSMIRTDDGTCHLFYSRWPRKLGHYAWVTHSEIAHAVADSPLGPYRHADVALPVRGKEFWDGLCTHNPTIHKFGSKFYLYYMGNTGDGVAMKTLNWTHRNNQRIGVAVADSPNGPWKRPDKPVVDVTPGFHDALMTSNPAVCATHEGKTLMVYKAVGTQKPAPFGGPVVHIAALAETPTGPFIKHPTPVFTKEGVLFAAEDPYIWCENKRYWAIVKDNEGYFTHAGKSLALFTSENGLDWKPTEKPLISTTEISWADGKKQKLNSLERPQLWRSESERGGKEAVLFCACDETKERTHSFNLAIPVEIR